MDSRTDAFVRKFSDAQHCLGSNSIHDLVSIKYRENVSSFTYEEFIKGFLQGEMNLEAKQVKGDFRGRTWLIQDSDKHKVLLVEHETGLEILYIAGSIASLLSLIPLITSGWRFMHSRFSDRHFPRDRGTGLEVRVIDNKNHLAEQHVTRIEDHILAECMKEIATLRARVERLEKTLKKANQNKNSAKSNSKKPIRQARRIAK